MVLICGRANQICQKRRICSAAIKYDALRMLRGSECYVLSGEKLMRRLDRCPNPYASPDDVAILFHGRMIIEQSPQRLQAHSVDQDYRPIVGTFKQIRAPLFPRITGAHHWMPPSRAGDRVMGPMALGDKHDRENCPKRTGPRA